MNITEIVATYEAKNELKKQLEKELENLKTIIVNYASDADTFNTDYHTVIIDRQIQNRLDTKAFYKDFPDAKDVYNKPVPITKVIIANKKQEKKTA